MSQSFILGKEKMYIPSVQEKIYWEVIVEDTQVLIIQRGGALEPTVLAIKGKDLDILRTGGVGGLDERPLREG